MASISKTVRPKRSNNASVNPVGHGLAVGRGTPTASAGATATKLAVTTQPAGAVSGVPFTTQPAVRLQSASSANVAEAGVTVTAYLVSGSGILGGGKTAVTDASGIATFSNLQITGTGAHTLGFSALMSTTQTIFLDDVETNKTSSYFEVDTAGGGFGRASVNGSMQWRAICSGAGPEYGNLKLGIGNTPSGVTSVGPSGVDFGLVTMECDISHSVNNLTNSQDKCLRMSVFSAGDWSQAAAVHIWSEGTTHLEIDPVTSVVNNVPTAVGWNDFAHFTWTGPTAGTNALFGATATTQRRLKVTWRLNDPGQANGYIQQYIDGVLDAQQTGLNLVQAYTGYGINAVHWENYITGGVTTANNRMYDNLAVTGQARSVVSANSLTVSTGASAAVTGTASSGWYESEVVTGGDTIILTLTSEAFVAAGATFDAQRQNIIDGIVASTSPTNGWNAVRSSIPVSAVVRTANTQVTITLPALASYSVTSNQTLTVTIPATALVQGQAIVASPTLTILEGSVPTGDPTPESTGGTIIYDTRTVWQTASSLAQLESYFDQDINSNLSAFQTDCDGAGTNGRQTNWIASQGTEQSAIMNKYFSGGVAPNSATRGMYFQWKSKYLPGYAYNSNGQGIKLWLGLRQADNGTNRLYYVENNSGGNIQCDNLNFSSPGYSASPVIGTPVTTTLFLNGTGGIIKIWRNGTLVLNLTGQNIGSGGFAQDQRLVAAFVPAVCTRYDWDYVAWVPPA